MLANVRYKGTHICVNKLGHHCFRKGHVPCLAPSHYLKLFTRNNVLFWNPIIKKICQRQISEAKTLLSTWGSRKFRFFLSGHKARPLDDTLTKSIALYCDGMDGYFWKISWGKITDLQFNFVFCDAQLFPSARVHSIHQQQEGKSKCDIWVEWRCRTRDSCTNMD